MKITAESVSLDSPSPLPLVPYFVPTPSKREQLEDGESRHATEGFSNPLFTREQSDEYAKTHFSCEEVSLKAIASVLHENYLRRVEEASSTSQSLRKLYFPSGNGDFNPDLPQQMMDFYASFMQADFNPHATIGQRSELFLDSDHPEPLKAYEVFARSRENETDFFDVSFAKACLEVVARGNPLKHGVVNSDPKLTREIKIGTDKELRVVTTKREVGSFDFSGETVALKDRQAGLLDYGSLDKNDTEVVDFLTRYNRDLGRTPELQEARSKLGVILASNPGIVNPVVESIFLTRTGTGD